MDAYTICDSCLRHVKRVERKCPFCGTNVHATSAARPIARRVSRAQLLAWSSVAVFGCSGAVAETSSDAGRDATADTAADAAADTAVTTPPPVDAGRDSAAPDTGLGCFEHLFPCGEQSCHTMNEVCVQGAYPGDEHCEAITACNPCPTCECMALHYPRPCRSCSDSDGGVFLNCPIATCYGAPPARLERLGRAARTRSRLVA